MEDRESAPRIARKSSAISLSAGHNGVNSGTTRITDAQCLSLAQQLVILDESTELPPFGMCMSGLQERLKRRLGLEIAESAIKACLSPYYDLAEWEDRYITKSLGVEVEEFGSADHPPRSPLEVFCLSSDGEEDDGSGDDDYDGEHTAVPAGSGTTFSDHAVDLGRADGGNVDDAGGGSAGDKMQEGEEEEDAATGAGAAGGGGFGTGIVGGGRARSGGGAGGGAAVAPVPAKAADAAGSKASSHIARPTAQRAGHNAPSSSTGEVFQRAKKHPRSTGMNSRWGAGGGGAIEVDGMEVQ